MKRTPRLLLCALIFAFLAITVVEAAEPKDELGFQTTPIIPGTPWHLHDGLRPQPRTVTPGSTFSQMAAAPSDATVLFDGKDMSRWETLKGEAPEWKVTDGYFEVAQARGDIRTKDKFADFQLHLEFATPSPGEGKGQERGNSGVLINGMYEVQVLDSYHQETYPDGQAAALYGQSPPLVNASKPPGEWQTYDIIFESPRWDERGMLIKKAAVTVLHNGVVVHHRREYTGPTDAGATFKTLTPYTTPHPPEVSIGLQWHRNAVRYRNIWIRTLGEYDKP